MREREEGETQEREREKEGERRRRERKGGGVLASVHDHFYADGERRAGSGPAQQERGELEWKGATLSEEALQT